MQRKRDYSTRRVNPTQALRLGNNKSPPPRPVPRSNPAPPHLPPPPPARAQVLEEKSTPDGECLTTELTSECMIVKELLGHLREVLARQRLKPTLVQLSQAPALTKEAPALMAALGLTRAAQGYLRCLDLLEEAEATRYRWEWVQVVAWMQAATQSRDRQVIAEAATLDGSANQMELLSGSRAAGRRRPTSKVVVVATSKVEAINRVAFIEALILTWILQHLMGTFSLETFTLDPTLNPEHAAVQDQHHRDPQARLDLRHRVSKAPLHASLVKATRLAA